MKSKNNFLVLFIILFSVSSVMAQEKKAKYTPEKLRQNFENVKEHDGKIFYELRLFRNPFIGLYEIRKVTGDSTKNRFVPLFQGMPVGKYQFGNNLNYSPLTKKERKAYLAQSNFPLHLKNYKADFWIQPYFAANFGNKNIPVQSNTSLGLQTQVFIRPGLSFSTGVIFPLVSQLDNRPNIIHLAATFLNQFYAAGNHFFSASAGTFYTDQYGLNFQYRYANLAKPWSFGVEAGLTGTYYYPKGGIYYNAMDELLLLADASYRFAKPNLTVKLQAGQFLWSDKGARIEMVRQFTNVELGVYATKTINGSTLGFNFAVPIPPGKIFQGKNARLRTTDEFRWEYTYTRGYKIGERYRVGYQLDQKLRQYHQDYLNTQYQQLK